MIPYIILASSFMRSSNQVKNHFADANVKNKKYFVVDKLVFKCLMPNKCCNFNFSQLLFNGLFTKS